MTDSDDEPVALSSHAMAALVEFQSEREARKAQFERLQAEAEKSMSLSMEVFAEDWNESQFWYSDETSDTLARQLLDGATSKTTIGVVSAPSAFVALKNILRAQPENEQPRLLLLEHDQRFNVFAEFIFYDFQQPLNLPVALKGSLDRIICDPPFLSEDCQAKAALTVRWLLKPGVPKPEPQPNAPRVIVCTGERMEAIVSKLYRPLGVKTTTFEPMHARGLSNEFYCYASFECPDWQWRSTEVL